MRIAAEAGVKHIVYVTSLPISSDSDEEEEEEIS